MNETHLSSSCTLTPFFMAKYLNEIVLWETHGHESCRIGSKKYFLELLYSHCLKKFPSGGVSKLVIKPCIKEVEGAVKTLVNPDVISYEKSFPYDEFNKIDDDEKKVILSNYFDSSFREVSVLKGWNADSVNGVSSCVRCSGLVYKAYLSKWVYGIRRKLKARLWCEIDINKADIYLVYQHGNGRLNQRFIVSTNPSAIDINRSILSVSCENDIDVVVILKNSQKLMFSDWS